jgi:hypothetical protein
MWTGKYDDRWQGVMNSHSALQHPDRKLQWAHSGECAIATGLPYSTMTEKVGLIKSWARATKTGHKVAASVRFEPIFCTYSKIDSVS